MEKIELGAFENCEKLTSSISNLEKLKYIGYNAFLNCKSIGISAGASTPDYLIDEVNKTLLSYKERI